MSERRRAQPPSPPERETKRWDTEAIADALGVPIESRVDQLYGQGVRFRLGQSPGTELELFPTSRTVRVTSEDMQLSLFRQDPPQLADEGVLFELPSRASRRWLSVSPDGVATLFYEPATSSEATESASQTPDTVEYPNSRRADDDAVSDDSAAPHAVSKSLSPDSPSSQEQEARVRLAGRLGTDVRYRTTRNGKLVASFPLGIKEEDGSTRWQDVLVFGERAANLRAGAAPTKGQYTEVIGYVHQREVTGKDGQRRTVEELYAVVVKAR
ncbi:MAG: single-stranded DNA-binding protein [Thermomicrobiales bacterium]